jgi:hypothetical protein
LNINIKKKLKIIKNNFVLYIFLLFLGFICGNIFGTFLIFFRNLINWDGFIILLLIIKIELINYLIYNKNIKNFKFLQIKILNFFFKRFKINLLSIKIFNFYKIGLLLGFFTDAFKVGS